MFCHKISSNSVYAREPASYNVVFLVPADYNTPMTKEKINVSIGPRNIGRPILPLEIVLENMELADRAPDSTTDGGPRPHTWNPPLISQDGWERENPYHRLR